MLARRNIFMENGSDTIPEENPTFSWKQLNTSPMAPDRCVDEMKISKQASRYASSEIQRRLPLVSLLMDVPISYFFVDDVGANSKCLTSDLT